MRSVLGSKPRGHCQKTKHSGDDAQEPSLCPGRLSAPQGSRVPGQPNFCCTQICQSKSEPGLAHTFPNVEGLAANRIPNTALTGCQPSAISFAAFPCKTRLIRSDNSSRWRSSAAPAAGWDVGASPQPSSPVHHMERYVFTHQNQ